MTTTKKWLRWTGWLTVLLLVANFLPAMMVNGQAATNAQPVYQVADVDGDYSEWDLTADFFADMYRAAKPQNEVQSKLYLRYDCQNEVLYVLVLAVDGYNILVSHEDTYVKLGNSITLVTDESGDDGNPPDFAWIGLSPDGTLAQGWEASAPLPAGSYTDLNVHTQIEGSETSAVEGRAIPLDLWCADYGDLPAAYQVTLNSDNGASHSIGLLRLGDDIDGELDGQPDVQAQLDDFSDRSDEDGIQRFPDEGWVAGATVHFTATVTGGTGWLVGWFDWNGDNDFDDPDEQIDFGTLSEGTHVLTVIVGKDYVKGSPVFSRFRLFDPDQQEIAVTGPAVNGEVEDYYWVFSQTAVNLASFDARPSVPAQSGWIILSLIVFGLSLALVRFLRRMA